MREAVKAVRAWDVRAGSGGPGLRGSERWVEVGAVEEGVVEVLMVEIGRRALQRLHCIKKRAK